jgi:plasmid stabilization system protein ParE
MGCKVVLSPQAIADLTQAVRHIAKDDPQAAERIGHALIDRVAILENFPLLGAPYPKRPGVRKLVSRPLRYFLSIKRGGGRVAILRYSHGAQEKPELDDL